jgi:hypothetical protein
MLSLGVTAENQVLPPHGNLLIMVPGVALELPSLVDVVQWIDDVATLRFSAASLPFSFVDSLLRRSLVEGERNESESSKMPKMREYKQLARRNALEYLWKNSALSMQKVLVSFFRQTMIQSSFFFFSVAARVFSD